MARPVALAALAVALAACVSTPPPEPVGRAQLGGSYRQIGVAPRPLLATCGGDAMAGETRAAVSSWLDVLRHTDGCNLSQVRYYAADATVSPLRQRLGLLAMRGDSCGAEAMRLDGRVTDLQTRLTRLAAATVPLCSLDATEADVERQLKATEDQMARLRHMVHQSFPEYGF